MPGNPVATNLENTQAQNYMPSVFLMLCFVFLTPDLVFWMVYYECGTWNRVLSINFAKIKSLLQSIWKKSASLRYLNYGWPCGCGLCARLRIFGCGWKSHPHIDICQKWQLFYQKMGQSGSVFNSKCPKCHYCSSPLVLSILRNENQESRITKFWLRKDDFFLLLM